MKHKVIAKNTFYQILTKGISSLIGFLITIIIARSFGVTGYGDFTKITAFVALFFLFIDFGLNAVFLQNSDKKENGFNKLFYFRLLMALAIFLAANLIAVFLPFNQTLGLGFSPLVRVGIFIYSFSLFTQAIITSATAVFQQKLNYFPYLVAVTIGSLLNLFVVSVFSYLGLSVLYIIFSFLLSNIMTSAATLFYVRKKILPVSFDFKYAKRIFTRSFPIGLMLIFNLIYFRADMLLLALLKPTSDVGIYGISYKFFDFLIALPLFLSNSLYPFLLSSKDNPKRFFSIIKSYALVFLAASMLIILPFWFLSPLLSLLKVGFAPAVIPFRILLLSLPFFFLTSFMQWILIALGRQRFLAYVYILSTFTNIILNILFIPQWSYLASAVITGISEGIVFALLVFKVYSVKIFLEKEQQNE
ncbi:MAG: oligosaccharide flippase family protein [Patescibacteria group bacterium]|nr:oligosaccharide flippase family protein [Patescibacteria group bacterium]